MVVKCEKCQKKFTAQYRLDQHMNRTVPCTRRYACVKCSREFQSQRHLDRHMDRVTPCVPDEVPVILDNNKENRCQYCNKTYANKSSLTRHLKICNKEVSMQAIMNMLKANNEQLLEQLKSGNGTTIINNTNNSLYLDNNLCIFGEEDPMLLDPEKISKMLLDDPNKFVPRLLREIHLNPDLPQNHNVYYDFKKDQAMIFTRVLINGVMVSTWQKRDFKKVSQDLVDKAKRYPTCLPLAQKIKPNSMDEVRYCRNLQIVTKEYNHSEQDLIDNKEMLIEVTNNKGFFKMIEDTTYISGTLPLIHLN